jgi:uncharacterized membrane protein
MKQSPIKTTAFQNICRTLLGIMLLFTGTGHLSFLKTDFLAQVPTWLPISPEWVVLLSGVVELMLGLSLVFLFRQKIVVGWIAALFFILIFPGNIAQLTEHRDAFGMHTDTARWLRLLFQPLLIFVSLWSTGAWQQWRNKNK